MGSWCPSPDDGLIAEDVFGVLQVAVSRHCGFPSVIFPIWREPSLIRACSCDLPLHPLW
jgi:hypothetical protein